MFVFKGSAAADASKNQNERDWRVIDHYNIQQLGKRPFTTMLQPTLHHRSLTEDTTRPPPPLTRLRSNTSIASRTFTEAPRPSRAPSVDQFTPRSSTERRSFSAASTHKRGGSSDSFTRSLMAKGSRLLRRQNSKNDLTPLHTLEWLDDINARGPPQDTKLSPTREAGGSLSPRYNISEPFNFQHLTHTTAQHVERIRKTSEGDLVSEFSAIRAGQAPGRELRGIKARNIQQGVYFSSSASETSSPPRTGYSDSPPESPALSRNWTDGFLPSPPQLQTKKLAGKRSIENFSQPSPSYHTAQSSPTSPLPPPRVSSLHITPDVFTFQESPANTTKAVEEDLEPQEHTLPECPDDTYDFSLPHAVTTPDDTAHPVKLLPFSLIRTELPGVPEEDEMSEGRRSSIATSIVRPTTPNSSVRHAKSFPSTRSSPQRWSGALPKTEEEEDVPVPMDDGRSVKFMTPCMEEHTQEVPARPHLPKHMSLHREESWEDVIDYCYKHEAEADCNFDWDLTSHTGGSNGATANLVIGSNDTQHCSNPSSVIRTSPKHACTTIRPSSSICSSSPPALEPLQTSLPDLQPLTGHSVESSFSSIPEAATPLPSDSTSFTKASTCNSKGWPSSVPDGPLIVPEDAASNSVFDDVYRDMLVSHAASDYQLLFSTGRVDGSIISNSPRSSRSPISKSSSQESFWHTQARRQRNTGSISSLPDLVQGRGNDGQETVEDRLADQVASLTTSDSAADGSQRRRSPSLAKDVALKSILSKAMAPEARDVPEVPLPLHPAFRERSSSDAGLLLTGAPMAPPPLPPQPAPARRMRSTSSASSLSSRRANRVSYSLFPSQVVR